MHQIHFTVSSLKEGYISRLFPLLLVLLRPAFDSSSVVSQEAGTAAQFIPRLLLRSSRRQMLLILLGYSRPISSSDIHESFDDRSPFA